MGIDLSTKVFRKIPIIITKNSEPKIKGWRAELPDNYESYKPAKYEDINFEDLGFHFGTRFEETHEQDPYVYPVKRDAVKSAKELVVKLGGRAKIWHI